MTDENKTDAPTEFVNPNNVVEHHGYALHVMLGLLRRYFAALLKLEEVTNFSTPQAVSFIERAGGIDHIYSYIRIAEQIDMDKFHPDLLTRINALIKTLQDKGVAQHRAAPPPDDFMPAGKTHIDDWTHRFSHRDDENVRYARWWFTQFRMPATMSMYYSKVMAEHKLFTTYQGKRYRVTGCSRLGDVWLRADFKKGEGYDHRIYVDDCSDWSKTP